MSQNKHGISTATASELVLGDKPYSIEWAIDGARNALAKHNRSGIQFGMFLVLLKEREKHGSFLSALEKIGINKRNAQRYIKRALFVLQNPGRFKSDNLSLLNNSKIDLLADLPETTIADIIDDDGSIAGYSADEIKTMTTNQFAEVLAQTQEALLAASGDVQDLERALGKQETYNETLEMKNEELKRRLVAKSRPGPYPECVETIRLDSTALADKALLCIDDLERLYARLENPELDPADPQTKANFGIAASTYFHNIRAIAAKAARLVALCHEQLNDQINDSIDGIPFLQEDEVRYVLSLRKTMVAEHNAEKIVRENSVKEKVGKVGRRKKVR